jgi:hypothetical protein
MFFRRISLSSVRLGEWYGDKIRFPQGSVPVNNHKLVGAVNANERIEVTVKIRPKSEDGLPTLDELPRL